MSRRTALKPALALLAASAIIVAAPSSTRSGAEDSTRSIHAPEASLLIPAKTRLIISYSRRALA